MTTTEAKNIAEQKEEKVEIIDKKKDSKAKAREIAKLPAKQQEKELDIVFNEDFKKGIEVLKEIVVLAKEFDKNINQANKDLLDFYSKELDRITEIIKDGKITDEERKTLNEIRKSLIDKSTESTERTQKLHQEARNEALKAGIKGTGKIVGTGLIVAGCLKALDKILNYFANSKK